MSTRSILVVLAMTMAVALPATAVADNGDGPEHPLPDFFEGVRATGAGSSHTAIASGVDALYQNPAGIARAPMYVVDGAFSYSPKGAITGAGVTDSLHNPEFALGLSWNYFFGIGDHDHLSGHDGRVAFGIPAVPEQISIGAGLRYLSFTDESLPRTDEDDEQTLFRGLTFDAGVNFRLGDTIHLGLKGENFIDHCADNSRCRGATPTRVTAGFGAGFETSFLFSGEASVDLTSGESPLFDFAAGAEYLAGQVAPIRIGFQRRAFLDRNFLTIGMGWRSEDFGIDGSYRHDLNQPDEMGYMALSFSLYLF